MAYGTCAAVRGAATCPGMCRPGRAATRRTCKRVCKGHGMHSVVRGTRARARGCGMHSCRYYSSPIQSTALPVPKRDAESKCSEQRAAARVWCKRGCRGVRPDVRCPHRRFQLIGKREDGRILHRLAMLGKRLQGCGRSAALDVVGQRHLRRFGALCHFGRGERLARRSSVHQAALSRKFTLRRTVGARPGARSANPAGRAQRTRYRGSFCRSWPSAS